MVWVRFDLRGVAGPLQGREQTWEVDGLAVVTGANGAGKTHLLRTLGESAEFLAEGRKGLYLDAHGLRSLLRPTYGGYASMRVRAGMAYESMMAIPPESGGDDSQESRRERARTAVADSLRVDIDRVALWEKRQQKTIDQFTVTDFLRCVPAYGRSSLFDGALNDRFSAYLEAQVENALAGFLHGYDPSRYPRPLTNDEFFDLKGEAPWVSMTRALQLAGMPYRFRVPSLTPWIDQRIVGVEAGVAGPIVTEPAVLLSADGAEIHIDSLSSGESTILALVASVYASDADGARPYTPDVLALDEVDAGLHPSMVRVLMKFVQEDLVDRLGITVIMTTHSPTTVALSPRNALWTLNPAHSAPLKRVSVDEALSELLIGVPALSVRYENRRFVFVESGNDARWYGDIVRLAPDFEGSELSLTFTAVGGKDGKGPEGCDRVISLVESLRSGGNLAVWGYVDRDSRADNHDFVKYAGERYSIENYVLDPLTVAAFLYRVHGHADPIPGLDRTALLRFQTSGIQLAVDLVVRAVATGEDDLTDLRTVAYSAGFTAQVPRFWLDTRGHDLEARIVTCWPMLRTHSNRLLDTVINSVWRDNPELIPADLVRSLLSLIR